MIIEDLRVMGIPLKKIKQIKEALFAEVNIGVDDLFDEKGMVKQEFKNAMPFHYSGTSFEEMALELERVKKEEPEILEIFGKYFQSPPPFVYFVLNVLYRMIDHRILVLHDGSMEVSADGTTGQWEQEVDTFDELMEKHRHEMTLVIPLSRYLNRLTTAAQYEEWVQKMNILNEVELEVIKMMREGNLKELRIILEPKKSHTDLVYIHTGITDSDTIHEVLNRFKEKKHVELTVKSNDGKTVHYEYQNRKRYGKEKNG